MLCAVPVVDEAAGGMQMLLVASISGRHMTSACSVGNTSQGLCMPETCCPRCLARCWSGGCRSDPGTATAEQPHDSVMHSQTAQHIAAQQTTGINSVCTYMKCSCAQTMKCGWHGSTCSDPSACVHLDSHTRAADSSKTLKTRFIKA